MQLAKAVFGILLCLAVIILGDTRFAQVPPIAKFFDPYHGFWQNAEFANPNLIDEVAAISLLDEEASVIVDQRGVPHIFAKNDHDLYFLQGYLTARDRLWQMEFQTHAAAGRVSEIIGEKTLAFDLEQRRIGMVWAAQKAIDAIQKDSLSWNVVTAYTAGVNAYINSLNQNKLPLEYKLLDYQPEPWTELKSSLLQKHMASMLTGTERDRPNTEAFKLLGSELFETLFPEQNYLPDPVVPNFKVSADSSKEDFTQAFLSGGSWSMPDLQPHFVGSNNWAVAGSRTESGSVILCNDPHLRLSLPSIWYEIQLNAPGVNCYGVSLPGAPGITVGFNDSIAWGVTNAGRDVKDYYAIRFKNGEKKAYKYGDEWREVKFKIEEVKVRGKASVIDTVYYTHYGPVAYSAQVAGKHLAVRWTAHNESNEMLAFYGFNRAKGLSDFKNSLKYYECPAQNFAYADVFGNIAIWQQGKFLKRPKNHGRFVLDGSNPSSDVTESIPQEHNPYVINPKRGFVSSANQAVADTNYPYYYTGVFEEFRNRTINDVLRKDSSVTLQDMKDLQLNNYNLLAAEALPIMLSYLDTLAFLDTNQTRAFAELQWWNYWNHGYMISPALFEVWWDELNNMVWDEFNSKKFWQGDYYKDSWIAMADGKKAK
ncbi:penicillin acylase family protein, partial [Bacteroidota bacterium]